MTRNTLAVLILGTMLSMAASPGMAAPRADAISSAAQAFLDSLDEEQTALATMPIDTDERATWSNLPIIMVRPAGVLIKDMTDEQQRAAHALMRATMSSQGYAKFAGIMVLEDMLHQIEAQDESRTGPRAAAFLATRDYGNYALSIFGKLPATTPQRTSPSPMVAWASRQPSWAAAPWKFRVDGMPA